MAKSNDYSDSSGWDPLESVGSSDQEIIAAAKKREIKNILKSYVGNYDSFSELIQNAMDAVEKRIGHEGIAFGPRITIKIDIEENSLEIVDNGCGFESEHFRSFLAPSISFKPGGDTRGNKGVGATYIAYGFNDLTVRTKSPNFAEVRRIRNGRDWVEDQTGTVARPKAEPAQTESDLFSGIDQGSSFKIIFGGNKTRPKSLSWFKANTPDQWLYLLLVKTPLGFISLPEAAASEIEFDLVIVDPKGTTLTKSDCVAKYKFPHEEIAASQPLRKVVEAQRNAVENDRDPAIAVRKFKNSNGLYEFFDCSQLLEAMPRLTAEQVELMEQFQISAYGYFAYSTEVWDQLNDKKAKLRKSYRIIRGGLQLANNHMPQGDLITIPLTKSIGHQNQAHIIVHFKDADPDLGRKGFQPELKTLAEEISVMVVRKLSSRRDILKSDSGAQAEIEKEIKVHEWIREQEEHENAHPLVLRHDHFFLPTNKVSVGSIPKSEQDVIVLFNQMIAGGIIRGISLLATSSVAQYDGVFRFRAEEPLANQVFDRLNNPLGVLDEQLTKPYRAPPKIIEYKFSLDGLIREFESGVKNAQDIELAVFWEMGQEYQKEFDVVSLLHFENVHQRDHHGLTHTLSSGRATIKAICLKELVELLNNADEAQEYQEATYGDGI